MKVAVGIASNVDLPLHDLLAAVIQGSGPSIMEDIATAGKDYLNHKVEKCPNIGEAPAVEGIENIGIGSRRHRGAADVPDKEFNEDALVDKGQTEEFKLMQGEAYKSLCTFMHNLETHGRSCCSCCPCLRVGLFSKSPQSQYQDWRSSMLRLPNGIGGYAWVLRDNAEKYKSAINSKFGS